MNCEHCPLPCARPNIGIHWYLELFRTAAGGQQLRICKASDHSLVRCWGAALTTKILSSIQLRPFKLIEKVSYINHGLLREVFLAAALCAVRGATENHARISLRCYGRLPCGGHLPTRADVIVGSIPTNAGCKDREMWLASLGIASLERTRGGHSAPAPTG